jgi:3,4-dihydroxy 2-butanone 4-phosphate synthase/GTP cyclohydrolase II
MQAMSSTEKIFHALYTLDFKQVECYAFGIPGEYPVAALVVGDIQKSEEPFVRVHSRCLYGEVFGSLDCDCRSQIDLAFKLIKDEGVGVFIYLEQEGRGCGLLNKAKSYVLREREGLDTVDAYKKLGLAIDARHYEVVAEVLQGLKLNRIRLLTNNPQKVIGLRQNGMTVRQVSLRTDPTPYNIDYLKVKQFKLGHDLGLVNSQVH